MSKWVEKKINAYIQGGNILVTHSTLQLETGITGMVQYICKSSHSVLQSKYMCGCCKSYIENKKKIINYMKREIMTLPNLWCLIV